MRYDDRLATVLRLSLAGQHVARIQMRQLLDLLGTSPPEARSEMLDTAYLRLADLSAKLPAAERAAMLRQPGLRLRSPRLVASLARSEPPVAAAALAAASLSEEEWLDLIPALPVHARALVHDNQSLPQRARELLARLGIGDRGLPRPEVAADTAIAVAGAEADAIPAVAPVAAPAPDLETPAAPAESDAGIGAIVRRIEAFRRIREEAAQAQNKLARSGTTEAPLLPLGGDLAHAAPRLVEQFDFTCDGEGRINWCEAMVAPMVVGTRLGNHPELAKAIHLHQPLRGMRLDLAGAPAIAGQWQVDAVPQFDRIGGRFTGYMGRAHRAPSAAAAKPVAADTETDRLRQLLHELRTPVNAIQGFAEIIQQQLFGPAPHEYRALAAHIAADAARMLAGFEELERYARLDSGAQAVEAGEADLSAIVATTIARLEAHTGPRKSGFAFVRPEAMRLAITPAEAERLCWRLFAVIAATAEVGEVLEVALERQAGDLVLSLQLPKAQAAWDDTALFHAAASPAAEAPQAGMFGTGFTLRLARAEARSAGGRLERQNDRLIVHLPGLTLPPVAPSLNPPVPVVSATNPVS